MKLPAAKLKELLVPGGYVSEDQFDAALKESGKAGLSLEGHLVEKGLISDANLGKIIASAYNVRFSELAQERIDQEVLRIIPEVAARSQKAVIFGYEKRKDGETVYKAASSDPENYTFFKLLEQKIGHPIEVFYATPLGIESALRYYQSALADQVKALIRSLEENPGHEENIVRLVDLFLEYAHDNRASDIHIEPLARGISVRFRIDGVLHEVAEYPKKLHDQIVFRIKIMSHLRTDEHGAAQDGRFTFGIHGEEGAFDVRVSLLPVSDGENVVMRILAENVRRLTLEELGISERDFEKVERAMVKPHGMILVVGPTGSGKTTTLYGILQILNKPEVNIMTIEDPIEYDIEHVQQIQVNAKKNLTFATGLRSIVRQDPDIIMVGEIRDTETADIAVNAAMTGHLLLSTLHANDAATTFPRLIEMNVEPFLVTSSVNIVIAQRLVRKICERCRASYELRDEELQIITSRADLTQYIKEIGGTDDFRKIRLFKGAGCRICGSTGYSGRTGIFELMEITKELRPLITEKAAADVIDSKAKELGMTSMLYNGMVKVFQGVTTLEEVIRVTKS